MKAPGKDIGIDAPMEPGVTLVEASAGTGKTYTITSLILRLIVERGFPIERLLVVTFTEAATAELQARVRGRIRRAYEAFARDEDPPDDLTIAALLARARAEDLRDEGRRRLQHALSLFDEASISTIHGFCQRVLQENAFESGLVFDTELIGDPADVIVGVVEDYWVDAQHQAPPIFLRYLQRQELTPRALVPLVRQVCQDPEMPVLPDTVSKPDFDFDALFVEFEAAREAWHRDGMELVEQLAAAADRGTLNRGTYRRDRIEKRGRETTAWFAADPSLLLKIDRVDVFGRAHVVGRTNKGKTTPEHPLLEQIDSLLTAWHAAETVLSAWRLAFERELVRFARREVPARKRRARVQSFDDLLHDLDRALRGDGGDRLADAIRRRYDAVLIDEFQDTDPVQYAIFERLFALASRPDGDGLLFLVGDPKQAIYGFRGADIFAYLGAARRAGEPFSLDTNRRSTPGLVAAVNTLFRAPGVFVLDDIHHPDVSTPDDARGPLVVNGRERPPLQILVVEPPESGPGPRISLPARVARQISRLLQAETLVDGRRVGPGDIAVLTRSNREGRDVHGALLDAGVPAVIRDGTSVFTSGDAEELRQILQAVMEPTRIDRVRAAITTHLFGRTGDELAAMERDPDTWEQTIDRFRGWHDTWLTRGFASMFRSLLDEPLPAAPDSADSRPGGLPARLLGRPDGERRMTNLLHLSELLHEAEANERLSPPGVVRWLIARQRTGGDDDATELRMEKDDDAVHVMTVHKSKGLEFPLVYVPFASKASRGAASAGTPIRFHDPEDERRTKLDMGSEDHGTHADVAAEESFAEDVRLLYVAITRAQYRCSLIWDTSARADRYARSPLAWLLFHPDDARATPGEVRDHVHHLGSGPMWATFDALTTRSDGAIEACKTYDKDVPPYEATEGREGELRARHFSRHAFPWRVSSYSGLIRHRDPGEPAGDRPGDDETTPDDLPPDIEGGERVPFADFPAGRRAGRCIHRIFEELDFADVDAGLPIIEEQLGRFGFDAKRWTTTVNEMVADTVATPLNDSGMRLADIAAGRRLNELDFVFPVRRRGSLPVSPARLAAVLRTAGGDEFTGLAERTAELGFAAFEGYLKGSIDLLFEHGGRWWVADYKTNRLGDTVDRYRTGRLAEAMRHGQYDLQALLYTVALHRFLSVRLSDYAYERHVGGALYLFVRGMAPARGPITGVYETRVPFAVVEAVDALFAGGTP